MHKLCERETIVVWLWCVVFYVCSSFAFLIFNYVCCSAHPLFVHIPYFHLVETVAPLSANINLRPFAHLPILSPENRRNEVTICLYIYLYACLVSAVRGSTTLLLIENQYVSKRANFDRICIWNKKQEKKINKCSNRIKFRPRRHSNNKHQMFSHFSVIFSLRSELNSYRYRYRIIIFSVSPRSCACIQKQYLKESERSVDSKSSPIAYLLGRSGNSSIGQSDGFVCLYFALPGWSSFSFVRAFLFDLFDDGKIYWAKGK